MPRSDETTVTHVAITWGDDYPLLATQLAQGEVLRIGGEGSALALCTPGPWTLIDGEGRLWVPQGARLDWLHRHGDAHAAERLEGKGEWWSLREGERARMCHAGLCFFVEAARPEPRTWRGFSGLSWDRGALVAMGGSLFLHGLILLLGALLPPTASALSLDMAGEELARARYLLTAAERLQPTPEPSWLENSEPSGGQDAAAAAGEEGEAGTPDERRTDSRASAPRGPAAPRPTLGAEQVSEVGILRALAGAQASIGDALFDPNALDPDAPRRMGKLFGEVVGASSGAFGLGLRNAGRGGGGQALGTHGVGNFNTLGGAGVGPGGAAPIGSQRTGGSAPRLRAQVELSGSLSKEAIRRTIRRRANEIRFCYEMGLRRRPDLEGRVRVFFMIQPDGSVGSAALRSSSVGDDEVNRCIVQAVRRWPFPRPENGGVVSVTYPFLLQSTP